MKSTLYDIVRVYTMLAKDIVRTYPSLSLELDKDIVRLQKESENRGLHFFVVLLPEMGKILDRSLSEERYLLELVPKGIKLKHNKPILFSGLLNLIFDSDNTMLGDADVTAVFYYRQLCYLFKKLRHTCADDILEKTVKEFLDVESALPTPTSAWSSDIPDWDNYVPQVPFRKERDFWASNPICQVFDVVSNIVACQIGQINPYELDYQHGPGSVADQRNTYTTKYEFPTWSAKLDSVFPYDWVATGDLNPPINYPLNEEVPSKLVAVPKTFKGPRLICCESISHQWVQQGIRRWLEGRVKDTCITRSIDFRSQLPNQIGALESSHSGTFATVDLSAASDRVSCDLVHYVFRTNTTLLDAIHASRTRWYKQSICSRLDSHGFFRKFAPMGSSLTFPIQTIVFTIICITGILAQRGLQPSIARIEEVSEEVRVFGDDIIIPSDSYGIVTLLLEKCGLKVNHEKSFSKGNFRESCGVDAFRGHDVTPGYILELDPSSASGLSSIVETSNNLHMKGLWCLAEQVLALVPESDRKLIPISGITCDRMGLSALSYSGPNTSHLARRWNLLLQRFEVRTLCNTAKVVRSKVDSPANLTQYFTERPNPDFHWESGQVSKVTLRKSVAWVAEV